jgi:hypothetical protein
MEVTQISTVNSGQRYRATVDGSRLQFIRRDDVVFIYTPASCLGGFNLSRFEDETLSPASIRAFVRDNFKRPEA